MKLTEDESMDTSSKDSTSHQPGILYQQSAVDAVDEYIEREGRKTNLIIHNFPEQIIDSQNQLQPVNDSQAFTELVKNDFELDINISKSIQLRKIKSDKSQLLLISLQNLCNKRNLL